MQKPNESLKRCNFKDVDFREKLSESTEMGFDQYESLKRIVKGDEKNIYELRMT